MAVRYTPEMLERAAREAKSWDEAVRLCGGIATAGSRRYLRAKMRDAGIDASHIPTRWVRHSDETLRGLVAVSPNVAEVMRHPYRPRELSHLSGALLPDRATHAEALMTHLIRSKGVCRD
ncbi:hypothetical protein [Streptomyces sp. NPDC048442]|uniref:hypothetical protein n=1 Tax=Streptomyces sp. NPDC048442 TaxID=3154823 RepID=UPI003426B9AE